VKKKLLLVLLIIVASYTVVGCESASLKENNNEENKIEKKEPNKELDQLRYYVPDDFENHQELIGLLYNDSSRKIFTKGNVYDDLIYIDVKKDEISTPLVQYVENINKNLPENDVQFMFTKDIILKNGTSSVFGRENYLIRDSLYYAYLVASKGYIYMISIHGPNSKNEEIKRLAKEVLSSFALKN